MENTVTMSLERYDELQSKINALEVKLMDGKIELIKMPFEFIEAYGDKLSLKLTEKGKGQLTQMFAKYESRYNLGISLDGELVWSAAEKKKPIPAEETF